MKCPYCGGLLGVVNTYKADPFKIRRRRVCSGCRSVVYTNEVFEEGLVNGGKEEEAVKQNGQEEEGSVKEKDA